MGVGQGNGTGPTIWATISTVFYVLRSNSFGTLLTALFSKHNVKIAVFDFVDDTDLIQTGLDQEDYWEVAKKLQSAMNLWEMCT